jgi:uncharacterized protein (DUF488 family)
MKRAARDGAPSATDTSEPILRQNMTHRFYTIGHSRRTLLDFVEVLRVYKIQNVVDVRHIPRSYTNPQFNRDTLPTNLGSVQIDYTHIAELGGLRGKQPGVVPSRNRFWKVGAFQNYADYALTQQFHAGLDRLRELGRARPSVIMCAEILWWRCHRRIIADYLMCAGESVVHIFDSDHDEPARLTFGAVPQPDGTVIYPAPVERLLSSEL